MPPNRKAKSWSSGNAVYHALVKGDGPASATAGPQIAEQFRLAIHGDLRTQRLSASLSAPRYVVVRPPARLRRATSGLISRFDDHNLVRTAGDIEMTVIAVEIVDASPRGRHRRTPAPATAPRPTARHRSAHRRASRCWEAICLEGHGAPAPDEWECGKEHSPARAPTRKCRWRGISRTTAPGLRRGETRIRCGTRRRDRWCRRRLRRWRRLRPSGTSRAPLRRVTDTAPAKTSTPQRGAPARHGRNVLHSRLSGYKTRSLHSGQRQRAKGKGEGKSLAGC